MTPPPEALPTVTFVVLAKAPVPGRVKTRLTSGYSAHEAAALAGAALLDTLDGVRAAGVRLDAGGAAGETGTPGLVCALTGDLALAAAPAALADGLSTFRVVAQRGEGLGERIAHAHLDAAGPAGATVQVGMDTPQADPAVLAAAAARVVAPDGPDAVIGPAADGGWWLLALRRAVDARLVAAVPMSTPQTGRLTRAALEAAGLLVETAPVLSDVDVPADVDRVAAACPGSRFAALADVLGVRPAVAS
ncbi:TIGR04282 family arsenosugar biosynthesis glycosyltransferase [Microlunatus flavus]|uniref:Glycosyltransferase involved in cell wall biogenesis n=1 Tax=Microlunatus flavus TaxID=1036181 RepID=A0A1H9GC94_9ACTN|nr:DUF2064 domain-containing protein [Microlunatus flavus]SEQ47706.1 hypothetical protein SAMN05421756_103579 [Microlunatus flavus]